MASKGIDSMLYAGDQSEVSVVIPTRNRPDHLRRLLNSISLQTVRPAEVLIIDSSDQVNYQEEIGLLYPRLKISFIPSKPSVCIQRNIGIRTATSEWILLIDDDIEVEPAYIETLLNNASQNPSCGAFAGRLLQEERDGWIDQYPPPSASGLIYKFIFQLPVWGDVLHAAQSPKNNPLLTRAKTFYTMRGNTFTLAGWPLITSWPRTFRTTVFSLGANLIRREWLLSSPYDERLDSNGIGDNYGVAIGFPGSNGIHVTDEVKAFHHRAKENRPEASIAYYKRVMALHLFISESDRFTQSTLRWFFWSLIGNALLFLGKGKFRLAGLTIKAMALIAVKRNYYIRSRERFHVDSNSPVR